jgi:hypothetical protein
MSEAPAGTPIPKVMSPEEAKKAVAGAQTPEPPKVKAKDPKGEEVYAFSVSVTEGSGRVWAGDFENKILNLEERVQVGLTASFMVGRVPWEVLDGDTQYLVTAIAHLSASLVKKPEWYAKVMELKNIRIITAIYAEVAKHEAYFRGSDAP